jgi:ligand-binding sensor domain-containing protein
MWFGADGLWCCNEHSLTELTTKNGLSHEGVWCIVEDRSGNIWVGTRYTGLCRYDGMSFTDVLGSGTDR